MSQVLLRPRAATAAKRLEPKARKKLAWWIARLKQDAFAGDQIPKARIPPQLGSRSRLPSAPTNAWRFELPLEYRGIYTVQSSPGTGTIVLLLEILSHRDYDGLLGYR